MYRSSLLLVSFLAYALAAPTSDAPSSNGTTPGCFIKVNMDMLNKMINLVLSKPEYSPQWVRDIVKSLDDTDKQEFIDLNNDFYSGKIQKANNVPEFLALLDKYAPHLAPKVRAGRAQFEKLMEGVTPQGQAFVKEWEGESFKAADNDCVTWFSNSMAMSKRFFEEEKKLTPETMASFQKQFPEYYDLWTKNPFVNMMRKYIQSLPANADVEQDKETMRALLKMGMDQANQAANSPAAQAPPTQ